MDPGSYTFRVKATNSDGMWNGQDTCLKIIIRAPWYKTVWFRLASVFGMMAFLMFLYRGRIRSVFKPDHSQKPFLMHLNDEIGTGTKK